MENDVVVVVERIKMKNEMEDVHDG